LHTVLTSSKCLHLRTFLTSSSKKANEHDDNHDSSQKQSSSTQDNQTSDSSQSHKDEHEHEHKVRQQILQASLPHVHEHGWTRKALQAGARDEGLPSAAHGMFPRGGAELIHFFYTKSNLELAEALRREVESARSQGTEKTQNKPFIRSALETRLRMIVPYLDTWPQAMAISALPQNAVQSFTNLLKLTDDVWFYAGDRSVDFNWYTKRLTLAAVYKSTEIYMVQDKSPNLTDTWAFLDNRLGDLQKFGATKTSLEKCEGVIKEACIGFSILGCNMLGLNSRNR
jgi:ubiquinone biosynthesis protein COQ9